MGATDEELYDQFLGFLASKGQVRELASEGVVRVSTFEDRTLEPPLRLHLTPDRFGEHLRATAPASGDADGLHPLETAWRRFLGDVTDAVRAAGPGETELLLEPPGVVARRPE